MALYIAEGPERCNIRSEKKVFSPASGEVMGKQKRLFVQARRGEAPGWAVEEALRTFEFRSLPERGVTVRQWMGWLDTIAEQKRMDWTDEERQLVESELDRRFRHVLKQVFPPKLPMPWPDIEKLRPVGRRTPEISASRLAEVAEATGFALADVLAYIRQEGWPEEVSRLLAADVQETTETEEERPAEAVVEA